MLVMPAIVVGAVVDVPLFPHTVKIIVVLPLEADGVPTAIDVDARYHVSELDDVLVGVAPMIAVATELEFTPVMSVSARG